MKRICILSAVLMLIIVAEAHGTHLPPVDLTHMKKAVSLDTPPVTIYFDNKSLNYYMEYERFDEESQNTIKDIVAFVPTNKIDPDIKIMITRSNGQIQYAYTISNSLKAKQSISEVVIRDLTSVTTIIAPPQWSKWDRQIEWKFSGWADLLTPPERDSIGPGESKMGFIFEDARLPRIRDMYISGSYTPDEIGISRAFHGESTKSVSRALNLVDNDSTNYVIRKTIAPYFTPIDTRSILCDTFILDLIGQVREAAALGWIKHDMRKDDDKGKGKDNDKGVKKGDDDDGDDHADDDADMDNKDKNLPGAAKSIIKKLTKVRRECQRGKFGSAREKLRVLIKQVNAQRGKHLTEEAYALIKFNAEFLLEKL